MHRFLGFLISIIGLGVVAWAYLDPSFRGSEGILKGSFCLPLSISVALLVLAWSIAKEQWRKFGLWFALALMGQAVALQMIDAGPLIHYQHYRPLQDIYSFLLVFLLIQTCVVGIGLRSRLGVIRDWIRRNFRTWQLLAICLVFILSSAAPSREFASYLTELSFSTLVQAVNLVNLFLVVWTFPQEGIVKLQRTLDKWFGQPEDRDRGASVETQSSSHADQGPTIENPKPVLSPSVVLTVGPVKGSKGQNRRVERFAILAAIWVMSLAAMLNLLVYERHPHLQDEVIYLYHAQYLANGAFTMPAPRVAEAFETDLMEIERNRWYASPPPGWPVVLAFGVLLGVPWLVNPILAGLNVLLAFTLIRELYNRWAACLAVFLLSVSPWHVFMAMSFMPHTLTLTCALFGAVALVWSRRTGKNTWAWFSGIAVGMATLIRPLDGAIVGGILGLWAVGLGGRRLRLPALAAFVLGCALVSAMVFPYNNALTGDPLVFPIMAYNDKRFGPKSNAMGFGPERGLGWPLDPFPGHAPLDAIINAQLNVFSLNIEMFGWSTGSLLLMALLICSGKSRKSDFLMFSVVAVVVAAYSLYWYSGGPDFGARYWYLIIVPCVALTISGLESLKKIIVSNIGDSRLESTRLTVAVLALALLALVNYFPWRAIDKYYHYLQMRPDIRYLDGKYHFGRSIVLIRGNSFPDYASAAAYNPVDFTASVPLYAWDRSPDIRARVLKAYPDRNVWIVEGPSLTGSGYKVVSWPQSSAQVAQQCEGDTGHRAVIKDSGHCTEQGQSQTSQSTNVGLRGIDESASNDAQIKNSEVPRSDFDITKDRHL